MFLRTRSAWYGLTLPLTAARLIFSKPILIFWSLLPIAITLALYGFVIVRMQTEAKAWLDTYFLSHGWDMRGWGAWLVILFSRVLLFLVAAMTFSLVASLAASPFNDFLAEKSEKWATPELPAVTDSSWGAKLRLLGIDLLKTLATTIAMVLALLLSWIPLLNALTFIVAFLLVTFQYISYPQTRRGTGLREGFRFLWNHIFACLGFGAALSVLFAIPVVASFAMPVAVVGGTLLVARARGGEGLKPLK